MTDRAPRDPRAQGFDDPTRDIRLPRVPGSPPAVVRPMRADPPADEPTDELVPAPGVLREKTLQFGHGDGSAGRPAAPAATQARPERARRWPWVLLVLLPLIVILGSGIWLFVLLSGA